MLSAKILSEVFPNARVLLKNYSKKKLVNLYCIKTSQHLTVKLIIYFDARECSVLSDMTNFIKLTMEGRCVTGATQGELPTSSLLESL